MDEIECSWMFYNSFVLGKALEIWCDKYNLCAEIVAYVRDKILEKER